MAGWRATPTNQNPSIISSRPLDSAGDYMKFISPPRTAARLWLPPNNAKPSLAKRLSPATASRSAFEMVGRLTVVHRCTRPRFRRPVLLTATGQHVYGHYLWQLFIGDVTGDAWCGTPGAASTSGRADASEAARNARPRLPFTHTTPSEA